VLTEIDPVRDPEWGGFVERAAGSVFHHPDWLRLLRDTYGYELTSCCVIGSDGRLAAGLPVAAIASRLTGRRLVSLPFSDLCPPLVAPGAPPGTVAAMARALRELSDSRGLTLQVRGSGGVLEDAPVDERFRHHVLALERDPDAVARRFTKPQVMRGVRRARREGLSAELRRDRDALAAFYRLHVRTRHRLGVPTQPRRFMLGLEPLFAEGLGFVLLVLRDDRPIAAAVFLAHHDVLTYKYGASDSRYLATRPNNLLFMEAIRWGCEHGFAALDFGRTHCDQDSLCRFKAAWGAPERELHYRRLGPAPAGARGERAERVLGAVIRRSPPVVGRAIGEVLYTHAG
jgi:CelD/BcsL family acetyltransferase involved in cellulose biosynthesis